jgi:hypothetical protein
MAVPKDDFEFDRLLTEALAARPEHPIAEDLAQRAMNLAIAQPTPVLSTGTLSAEAIEKLTRLRRRNRLIAIAAGLMIGLLIAFGANRIVNGGYLNDALGLSSSDSTATSTTSSTTSISLGVVLTGEALIVGLFLLTFAGLSQRPQSGPASELAMW